MSMRVEKSDYEEETGAEEESERKEKIRRGTRERSLSGGSQVASTSYSVQGGERALREESFQKG